MCVSLFYFLSMNMELWSDKGVTILNNVFSDLVVINDPFKRFLLCYSSIPFMPSL